MGVFSDILLACTINTLMLAMFYILVALGLTLVYSILDIVNFAHAEFYMMGGFISYILFAQLHINYFLTISAAFLIVGAIGVIIEKFIFKRFRGKILQSFIVSLGLIWIFRESMRFIFGQWPKEVPVAFKGIITIGKTSFSVERLVITIIGFLLIVGLYFFITKTKQGRAMRAISQNPEAAALQGIDIDFISPLAFGIGCGLAAIAGVLVGSVFYVSYSMGAPLILKAFIIIILGGLGSIPGCLLGCLILGFVDSFGGAFFTAPKVEFITYMLIFVLLVFRPRGLLGHE
jgi:branched-chain amino acid transport system permease protein